MRRKCCVPSCNSGTKCSICQVSLSYFKIPRDPSITRKWEQALGFRAQQRLQPRDRVCSSHFKKYDIITKRFVSLKRPSTNSKMILEISKLDRDAIPSTFRQCITMCTHSRSKRSSIKSCTKRSRSESTSIASEAASSPSEDSDESSSCDRAKDVRESEQLTRKDYRMVVRNVENRSKRRHIRALGTLRVKWLEKKKNLERDIYLLEEKLSELNSRRLEAGSFDSD